MIFVELVSINLIMILYEKQLHKKRLNEWIRATTMNITNKTQRRKWIQNRTGGWLLLANRRNIFFISSIECEGWRRHYSLINLILLFTKPNIELSGWLYQTITHFTHIVYQPFSRVSPPSFTLYGLGWRCKWCITLEYKSLKISINPNTDRGVISDPN